MTQKEIVAEFGELLNQLEAELVEGNRRVELAIENLEAALRSPSESFGWRLVQVALDVLKGEGEL